MQPISLQINAHLYNRGDDHALLHVPEAPQQILRLALITRGAERNIFPALALDDWGRERKGSGLYRWLYEQGTRFPRAEIFGFDAQGDETQMFLRDLELSFRFPCFVYPDESSAVSAGIRVHTIFCPGDTGLTVPVKTPPPPDTPFALRRAALYWRLIDPTALPSLNWRPLPPAA